MKKKGGWGQETETIQRFSCTKLNKSMLIKANRNFLKEEWSVSNISNYMHVPSNLMNSGK